MPDIAIKQRKINSGGMPKNAHRQNIDHPKNSADSVLFLNHREALFDDDVEERRV